MTEKKFNEPEVNVETAAKLGLTYDEYNHIIEILGRIPSFTELSIFSVMWSEHCSYKNSKRLLKTFPTKGDRILQGPGENAGIVDIGDGLAIIFKIESHNHPSAIEPFQGAATGIGGILRDIFTMGARPIALLDSLRFGDPEIPKNRYITKGVIAGIAFYGNCVGVPTVAGETYFMKEYNGNPLVNVMCVGLSTHKEITMAQANRPGSLVVYYGNATGRDGIHGATFASKEMDSSSFEDRPAVQVGDPFMGKKILEATLDLIKSGVVDGIQDMGAAGLTCSTCEMAGRGGTGVEIDLDKVPQRAKNLTSFELMLSESQERMLAVIPEENIPKAAAILEKWELGCHVLGKITTDGRMKVSHKGRLVADVPAKKISDDSPEYVRESKYPEYLNTIPQFDKKDLPEESPAELKKIILDLLKYPTIASKNWAYQQYDHQVQTNSVVPPGSSAAIIRIKNTNKHIAIKTDCNGLFCYLNPEMGGAMAVAESARNCVVCGAEPLAITNCLNFGNPMKPEIFYQFENAVKGIGKACRVFNTPVTGGNVSLYNEFEGKAVFPTPVIGMIGLIEKPEWITPQCFVNAGDKIILLGKPASHLGGSQFYYALKDKIIGPCPEIDLEFEKKLQAFVLDSIRKRLINSAQDISDGGLGVALAESVIFSKFKRGTNVNLGKNEVGAKIFLNSKNIYIDLFSEEPSRIIITTGIDKVKQITEAAEKCGIPVSVIGEVTEEPVLKIENIFSVEISEMESSYFSGF